MSLEETIRKQIEFYFGDINLSKDKFLQSATAQNNGWVQISILLTFNRIKALTTDPMVILNSLTTSTLIQVNEATNSIRRKTSLIKPFIDVMKGVYVGGVPIDTINVIDLIKETFIGYDILFIKVLRDNSIFNGSVLIDFNTRQDADKAIESSFNIGSESLTISRKIDYINQQRDKRNSESLYSLYFDSHPLTLLSDVSNYFNLIKDVKYIQFIPGIKGGLVLFFDACNDVLDTCHENEFIFGIRGANEDEFKKVSLEFEERFGRRKKSVGGNGNGNNQRGGFRSDRGDKRRRIN